MSCFWDALAHGLPPAAGLSSPAIILDALQTSNCLTTDMTVNDESLGSQAMQENFDSIKELQHDQLYNGYWCSTSDPVLCLLCQLYRVNIKHVLVGTTTCLLIALLTGARRLFRHLVVGTVVRGILSVFWCICWG